MAKKKKKSKKSKVPPSVPYIPSVNTSKPKCPRCKSNSGPVLRDYMSVFSRGRRVSWIETWLCERCCFEWLDKRDVDLFVKIETAKREIKNG